MHDIYYRNANSVWASLHGKYVVSGISNFILFFQSKTR